MKRVIFLIFVSSTLLLNIATSLGEKELNLKDQVAFSVGKVVNHEYFKSPDPKWKIIQKMKIDLENKNRSLQFKDDRIWKMYTPDFDKFLTIRKGMRVGKLKLNSFQNLGEIKTFYYGQTEFISDLFIEFEKKDKWPLEYKDLFDGLYIISKKADTEIIPTMIKEIKDAKKKEIITNHVLEYFNSNKAAFSRLFVFERVNKDKISFAEIKDKLLSNYNIIAWSANSSSGIKRIIKGSGSANCSDFTFIHYDDGEQIIFSAQKKYFGTRFHALFKIENVYLVWISWNKPASGYGGDSVYQIDGKKFIEIFVDASWSD